MGRKGVVESYKMIDAGNLASAITSNIVNVLNIDKASIHLEWAGTAPVGVMTVQARNGSADSWYDLDFGTPIAISGASGDHQIVFNEVPFTDIKLSYAATSGTGSIDARITMKTVGQ